MHIPKLRPYLEVGCTVPFDFHEVISLVAPRAFLTFSRKQDEIFPHWQGSVAAAVETAKVYRLFGAEHKFKSVIQEGKHDFPADSRSLAYAWIDQRLAATSLAFPVRLFP